MTLLFLLGGIRIEAQPIDLSAEKPRREMPVDLDGHARVPVAQDALHGRRARPGHHQQAGRRVPEVVEADGADLGLGPEAVIVDRAAPL
ncbi:MAG: hypothetical protein L6Q84_03615 [Polyangiaceae bacterium]|nr:hypothetical protein [Polyangiaceae bacterium]